MTNLQTFTNRLAVRLSTFKGATKVRETASNIDATIQNEFEIVKEYNFNNKKYINEWGLKFLAYNAGSVPKTKKAQEKWLADTIQTLKEYRTL
jgi:hypothetical protein